MTTPRVAVLCPRRTGVANRDQVWQFVRAWWCDRMPAGWSLFEGHHDEGPFNRSLAINRAGELADQAGGFDVAISIDADVLLDMGQLVAGVRWAWNTGVPVIGYTERIHMSRSMSRRVMAGYTGDWMPGRQFVKLDAVSSANIVRRDVWDALDGYDPMFVGWGSEDIAWKHATEAVARQGTRRMPGPIWHLWHPNTVERGRAFRDLVDANKARAQLYVDAVNDPGATIALSQQRHQVAA